MKPNDVQLDALGDLRILRNSIVHNAGILTATEHAKMKALQSVCHPDVRISPTNGGMHKIFVAIKRSIGALILHYTGNLPGAPTAAEITGIAISARSRRS